MFLLTGIATVRAIEILAETASHQISSRCFLDGHIDVLLSVGSVVFMFFGTILGYQGNRNISRAFLLAGIANVRAIEILTEAASRQI